MEDDEFLPIRGQPRMVNSCIFAVTTYMYAPDTVDFSEVMSHHVKTVLLR